MKKPQFRPGALAKERLLEELVLRRLVAEFVGRSYNKVLFSYAVRKLQGRVR